MKYSVLLPAISIALAAPCFGGAADSCTELFRQVNRTISRGYVNEDAANAIKGIFENSSVDDAQKAKLAFDVVVNQRLQLLDPAEQSIIRELLNENVYRRYYTSGKGFDAYFKPGPKPGNVGKPAKIEMNLPQGLRGTILEYAILNHELEHAIQDAIKRGKIAPGSKLNEFVGRPMNLPNRRFQQETGAMFAEYEYLRNIPTNVKRQMIPEIHSSPLSKESKAMLLRWVQEEDSRLGVHVKNEHLAGRYSRNQLKAEGYLAYAGFVAAVPLLEVNVEALCFTLGKKRTEIGFVQPAFFHDVCNRLPYVFLPPPEYKTVQPQYAPSSR